MGRPHRPLIGRLHTSGERVVDRAGRQDVRRPGQQEPSGRCVPVHGVLDREEQVGNPLDLVYEHGAAQPGDEPLGVRESGFACLAAV
jgi:hypothetical protein